MLTSYSSQVVDDQYDENLIRVPSGPQKAHTNQRILWVFDLVSYLIFAARRAGLTPNYEKNPYQLQVAEPNH